MWITRDFNGTLKLWKIKPVRYIERLHASSKENIELEIHLRSVFGRNYSSSACWEYPYEYTTEKYGHPKDYLDPEELNMLDAENVILLDKELYPEIHWYDDPVYVEMYKISPIFDENLLSLLDKVYDMAKVGPCFIANNPEENNFYKDLKDISSELKDKLKIILEKSKN